MPLCVSCTGAVLRPFSSWEGGPIPSSSCLAWGRSPPRGQACFCLLALRALGAVGGRLGGGRLSLLVWGVRGWAPSHARPTVLAVYGLGLLPTGCGCGGCGRGDLSPAPQRAFLRAGFARCGGGTRVPWGGHRLAGCRASWVGRSPTPDRPSLGRAVGPRHPLPVGAEGVGVGTRHLLHSVPFCELAFRATGAGPGRLGGLLLPGCGLSWVHRSSTPDR